MKITKGMKIADVLKQYPSTRKVLAKRIPSCIRCGGASVEDIKRGAEMHGIDPDVLVEELNLAAGPRKKRQG
jgi:hybrid cluster-associated redox disulfide protein